MCFHLCIPGSPESLLDLLSATASEQNWVFVYSGGLKQVYSRTETLNHMPKYLWGWATSTAILYNVILKNVNMPTYKGTLNFLSRLHRTCLFFTFQLSFCLTSVTSLVFSHMFCHSLAPRFPQIFILTRFLSQFIPKWKKVDIFLQTKHCRKGR